MKVFIFGAGASYASQNHLYGETNFRSPLTKDLFDKKYAKYLDLVYFKEEDFNFFKKDYTPEQDLEEWLTEKWDGLNKEVNPRKKERGYNLFSKFTFYVWVILWQLSKKYDEDTNLYSTFLKWLKRNLDENGEDYRIITFNYDVFLDRAFLNVFDEPLRDLDDYIKVHILKPHGSINWFLKWRESDILPEHFSDNDVKGRINRACSQLYRGVPFELEKNVYVTADHPHLQSSLADLINERFDRRYFYPLVFIPLTEKITALIKGFNEKISEEAKKYFEEATEIYLIGYRANDKFIKELFNTLREGVVIKIIGNNNAEEISDKLKRDHSQFTNIEAKTYGFEGFLKEYTT